MADRPIPHGCLEETYRVERQAEVLKRGLRSLGATCYSTQFHSRTSGGFFYDLDGVRSWAGVTVADRRTLVDETLKNSYLPPRGPAKDTTTRLRRPYMVHTTEPGAYPYHFEYPQYPYGGYTTLEQPEFTPWPDNFTSPTPPSIAEHIAMKNESYTRTRTRKSEWWTGDEDEAQLVETPSRVPRWTEDDLVLIRAEDSVKSREWLRQFLGVPKSALPDLYPDVAVRGKPGTPGKGRKKRGKG